MDKNFTNLEVKENNRARFRTAYAELAVENCQSGLLSSHPAIDIAKIPNESFENLEKILSKFFTVNCTLSSLFMLVKTSLLVSL